MNAKRISAFLTAVAIALAATLLLIAAVKSGTVFLPLAKSCTDRYILSMEHDPLKQADYIQQRQACEKKAVTQVAPPKQTPTPTPTPSSPSPSIAATPPPADNVYRWTPYAKEYLGVRPDKSVNSYGPHESLFVRPGTSLENLSAEEFLSELKQRMPYSPVLTASLGASRGLWSWEDANSKVKEFLAHPEAWEDAVKRVSDKLEADLADGVTKVQQKAGSYDATFLLVGTDGVPAILRNADDHPVNRTDPFWSVTFKDGTIIRMECGGQEYWERQTDAPHRAPATHSPAPASQAPATPSPKPVAQTPVKKAPVIETFEPTIPGVERDQEFTPVPVKQTPTPSSPAPSETPTTTPTTEPSSPAPSETPTTTPTTVPKDPAEDINVNPQIPEREQVAPVQTAASSQAQSTQPTVAPTTARTNPPAPAPTSSSVPTTRTEVPANEGGDTVATGDPEGP